MTSARVLTLSLPVGVLIAGIAMLLPSTGASWYAKVTHPGLLFVGSALSLWVAPMYRGDMRRVFLSLSVFLLLYGLISTTPLVDTVGEMLEANFFRALLAYQLATYAFLLTACVFILRVINVSRLNVWGWFSVAAGVALAIAIVLDAIPTYRDPDVFGSNTEAALLYLLIRIFDVLVMVMLIPVVWLYVQNARARYQESATFAVIGGGVVASLVLVDLYHFLTEKSLLDIATSEFQTGSLLDALYLFGAFLLAVGLFAHRKHQEWSFNRLDRLLL